MQLAKVLIVDSDFEIVEAIRGHMVGAGFEPICANGNLEGMQKFLECLPDAVILRDSLPGQSGLELAWRIRAMSDIPILFISDRQDKFSLERALRVGDDYMAQPWRWERLSAKLSALLKRRVAKAHHVFSWEDGHLKIDFANRQVTKAGKPVHLTGTEFKLLSCFVRKANRVLRYDELLADVWGHTDPKARSQVSLYVRYLRKKIEDDPSRPTYFCTERGVGYSFRPRVKG